MLLRRLWPSGHATNRNLVRINVLVPIGATGAVGTHVGKGGTVTRTNTGLYTFTPAGVQGSVGAILKADCQVISSNKTVAFCLTRTLATGVCTFATCDAAAADTPSDPDSGAFLAFEIVIRNSSADRS